MKCFILLQKRRTLQRKALKSCFVLFGISIWIYVTAFVLKGTSLKENSRLKRDRINTQNLEHTEPNGAFYAAKNLTVNRGSNSEKESTVLLKAWPTLDFREIHNMKLSFDSRQYPLTVNFQELVDAVLSGRAVKNKIINTHPFRYEHTANNTCTGKQLQLVVLVKSKPSNFKMRSTIRTTWGNLTNQDTAIVFLLGHEDAFISNIAMESAIHRDVVQEDFVDSLKSRTLKMVMAFNWVYKFCSNAKFILLVEDDTFISLGNIKRYIKRTSVKRGLLAGYLTRNSSPYRDEGSKWFVSLEEYPFVKYPPYLGEFFILMSQDVARSLSIAIPFVKPLPLENIFLGIVAAKLNIKPRSCPGLVRDLHKSLSLVNSNINFKSVLGYHSISSSESLKVTWDLYKDCQKYNC